MTCLATWKDGNARYLVGLVSHHHATSNEERFRCFVYEKIQNSMGMYTYLIIPSQNDCHTTDYYFSRLFTGGAKDAEYKLAQSGDATCNGLESAEVCI